ncbi:rRNA maturation RNase YbeY [Moraxella sp. FZLJ2107]|nr:MULTISPECIES: rRNA maturation RNase YbeY [unclassified Moraxella]UTO05242.1 rRNA maturation RNase YbeY [Moraxella sp. FZLJ2107]UTO21977.1 rRNA maturation RNase YbeY [Moraxella sp. FZLJ2109]
MSHEVFVSCNDILDGALIAQYDGFDFETVLATALSVMDDKLANGASFRYFDNAVDYWHKPKTLSIYITDAQEGRALNLDARGKDYATNVLSYPSELPSYLLDELPEIELGELIFCHDVVAKEADEQGKRFNDHLTHLTVHGILHLLGFDHEISDADADEMESFEIEILAKLGIGNPYLDQ